MVASYRVDEFDAIRQRLDAAEVSEAAQRSRGDDDARRLRESFEALVARFVREAETKLQPCHGYTELPVRFEPSKFGFDLRPAYRRRVATGLRAMRVDAREMMLYPVMSSVKRGDGFGQQDSITTFYVTKDGDWHRAATAIPGDAENPTRVDELGHWLLREAAEKVLYPIGIRGSTPQAARYWNRRAQESPPSHFTSPKDAVRIDRWVDALKSAVAEAEELLPSSWVVCQPSAVDLGPASPGHEVRFENGFYAVWASIEQMGEWLVRAATGDVRIAY